MAQITEAADIDRQSLYKALRADASPRFDTFAKVCKALGVRLVVQAVHPA
jgi:probable addiction module antidote protein